MEVKSFAGSSAIFEFHTALGQFLNYRQALEEHEPQRILFLAVPHDVYDTFFALKFIQTAAQRHQLKLVVYDTKNEVIVTWIN